MEEELKLEVARGLSTEGTNLEVLATRAGFNAAVRHIREAVDLAASLGEGRSLGDLLAAPEDGDRGSRTALLLRMLLIDKLGYEARSANLETPVQDPSPLAEEFARWEAVDLLAAYHHPDRGLLTANPKARSALARFGPLKQRELLVIYAGPAGPASGRLCRRAAEAALALFAGARVRVPPELYRESPPALPAGARPRRARSITAPPPAGQLRITPRYSVAVRNECFHNGNVEAWKRIIESYNAAYPEVRVHIYYGDERILNINSLFTWGKVKHGSSIQFALEGRDIRDTAKLQRYLLQGASPHFEAFLQGPMGSILPLF